MVWDQGINYLLARGLKPLGVEVDCMHRAEYDPFGMTPREWKRSYPFPRWDAKMFGAHVFLRAFIDDPDIIHVHSFDKCVPTLSDIAPVVLHYHGSDIRGRWAEKRPLWLKADRILVSTRDLLEGAPVCAEYLPNPIDTEMFKPTVGRREDTALHFNYGAVDLAQKIADEHSVKLVIREKGQRYADMPSIFGGYTHYIDVKRDGAGRVLISNPGDSGSLIGLQALACGCEVLTVNGARPLGLPPEHRPENVAKRLFKVYRELM
jgi:glycosyltransferase involved in cell wall biosynthesis